MSKLTRRVVGAGYLIVLAILGLAAVLALTGLHTLDEGNRRIDENRRVVFELQNLLSVLKDAELGQRGYLLTGREAYLAPFRTAELDLEESFARLRTLVDAEGDRVQIAEIGRLAEEKMDELGETIALRRGNGPAAALELVNTDRGIRLMDRAREVVADLENGERRRLEARRQTTRRALARTLAATAMTTLTALTLLAAVWVLDRRRAQAETREARTVQTERAWLATTLASIGDAVIATDGTGRVKLMNPIAEAVTGWPQQEAAGRPLSEVFRIVHENTGQPEESPVDKVLRQGMTVSLHKHTALIARNGSALPIEDSAAPIRDSTGATTGVVLVFREVSRRREEEHRRERAEQALRASESRFRRLFESDLIGIAFLDRFGAHLDGNDAFLRMVGYTRDDLHAGRVRWDAMTPAEFRPLDERGIAEAAHRGACTPYEKSYIRKDGSRIPLLIGYAQLGDATDQYVAFLLDLSERKRTEDRLQAQLELTRTITDNATTAIFVTDPLGRCTFMNPAAQAMTGYTFAEAEGRVLHDLILPCPPNPRAGPDGTSPIARALLGQIAIKGHDDVFLRKHGAAVPVSCHTQPIRKLGVPVGTVVEARDTTQEKETEGRIRRLLDDLREEDRRKDKFLAMLAHELRNPLAPIRNAVALLRLGGADATSREWARSVIDRQVGHLNRLVDDLLDVSRISRGKITLQRLPLSVDALIAGAIESTRPAFEARGHHLEVTIPDPIPRVRGDLTRLIQVVLNLLNNAAKYTPQGGHIHVAAQQDGPNVIIRVSDDGVGIPAEMLPRVFDLFVQVDRSLDRSEGGLGIGLTLVRKIVELHGGTVEAQSDGPGQGSSFLVRLPALFADSPAPPATDPDNADSPGSADPRSILIVDDNQDAADTLARYLTGLGHEVHVAYDGPNALSQTTTYAPDVVLLDIGLPGLDGYEVARRMRTQSGLEATRFAALTGYGSESDRLLSVHAGFEAHLTKPVDLDALKGFLQGREPARSG